MKARSAAAPYMLWSAIFIIVPLVLVAISAFTAGEGGFTLADFKDSVEFAPVIFNSIWLSMIATAICLIIAYPLAYIMLTNPPRECEIKLTLGMRPVKHKKSYETLSITVCNSSYTSL